MSWVVSARQLSKFLLGQRRLFAQSIQRITPVAVCIHAGKLFPVSVLKEVNHPESYPGVNLDQILYRWSVLNQVSRGNHSLVLHPKNLSSSTCSLIKSKILNSRSRMLNGDKLDARRSLLIALRYRSTHSFLEEAILDNLDANNSIRLAPQKFYVERI